VGPEFYGNEIAHAASGDEKSRFFIEDFGSALLEIVDGGVLAVNVVTNFSGGHGAAHFFAGTCDGVAAQVNDVIDRGDVVGIDQLIAFCDRIGHGVLHSRVVRIGHG
jgi:hypothetical protein